MSKPDIPAIATILSIVGAVVALGWWAKLGWMTPDEHKADIDHIEDHAQKTEQAIVEFQTRWMCDEDQEELEDLLKQPTRTPLELERVIQLRDAIDERDCHNYK